MVKDVPEVRGSLSRGGKMSRGGINLRGGAQYPEVGQSSSVGHKPVQGGEAGFYCQDIGWGTGETVRAPSLDLVPKDRQLPHHVHRRGEDVSPIAQDGEEKGCSQVVAVVGGVTHSGRGEPFYCHEGGLGLGQSFSEVGGGCQ